MKLIRLNMLSLAFVLGSSLSYAPLVVAQGGAGAADADEDEDACIEAIGEEFSDAIQDLLACAKSAIKDHNGDEGEAEAINDSCADEYAEYNKVRQSVTLDALKNCVNKED